MIFYNSCKWHIALQTAIINCDVMWRIIYTDSSSSRKHHKLDHLINRLPYFKKIGTGHHVWWMLFKFLLFKRAVSAGWRLMHCPFLNPYHDPLQVQEWKVQHTLINFVGWNLGDELQWHAFFVLGWIFTFKMSFLFAIAQSKHISLVLEIATGTKVGKETVLKKVVIEAIEYQTTLSKRQVRSCKIDICNWTTYFYYGQTVIFYFQPHFIRNRPNGGFL